MNKIIDYVSELLAVIHKDGGHYEIEHGRDKACQDAIDKYYWHLVENECICECKIDDKDKIKP